ncbi:MAG TPA: hypothetical protein DCY07_00345, partial [Rhodospirillaceae bacterium]|nr:hypothetical protein [Rhodospirillaceae bacterium]
PSAIKNAPQSGAFFYERCGKTQALPLISRNFNRIMVKRISDCAGEPFAVMMPSRLRKSRFVPALASYDADRFQQVTQNRNKPAQKRTQGALSPVLGHSRSPNSEGGLR